MDNTKKTRNGPSSVSKQDGTGTTRQWPKNARRRETKGGQEGHQQQQGLRNTGNNNATGGQQLQQFRNNNEKRSRWNRNNHNNNNAASLRPAMAEAPGLTGDADTEEEETYLDIAEWDSVLVPGSKKHNLNHLLNFHYAPRDRDLLMHNRPRGSGPKQKGHHKSSSGASSAMPLYNKDQFLQANCNFIVRDTGNYKAHWNNPDMLVDWQQIEEVVIRSSEDPQCPICLFPPVAAKMTKCGHVYCWSCILHYLALSDKEWRKCPICYDAVRIKDLRSTVSWPYHEYANNETVDFQLMCRRKGSLEVIKVGEEVKQMRDEGKGKQFPHLFQVRERQIVHSKLILANKLEVLSILDRERCELQDQMRTDGPEGLNCPEMMFITQAMDLLDERSRGVNSLVEVEAIVTPLEDPPIALYDDMPVAGEEGSPDGATAATFGLEDNFYYFYQAVDGQHLFLHSLNLRMLQAQYGSLANCPPVLSGRIIHREHFSVSEALRKRSKYLSHLPLTSIITIVEVSFLGEDLLFSAQVKEQFAEEVNQRKRDRQRRARDEKKREKQINDLNERQMGKILSQGFVREVEQEYPFLMNEVDGGSLEGAVGGVAGGGGSGDAEITASSSPKPFSFAKMLQCTSEIEKAQPEFWPTLDNKKPTGASAWGTQSSSSTTDCPVLGSGNGKEKSKKLSKMDKHFPNLLDTIEVEDDEEGENGNPGIVGDYSTAPESSTKRATPSKVGPKGNNNNNSSSGKRMPKKKMLLFTTDMNRNINRN